MFSYAVVKEFEERVGYSTRFSPGSQDREQLSQYLPASQAELPPRRMIVISAISH